MTDGSALGLVQPVLGAAHLLALVAVGLWGDALGGRASLVLPAAFVLGMGVGYLAGLDGVFLVHASVTLWASLIALVTALLFKVRLPLAEAAGTVALFGLCHGITLSGALGSPVTGP